MRGNYVTILLIIIAVAVFIAVTVITEANALTREEEKEIKNKINSAEKSIESLEGTINKTKTEINENQLEINNAKTELRSAKQNSNGTWAQIQNIMDLEKKLTNAEKLWKESREKLFSLLREKSDFIKVIRNSTAMLQNAVIVQENKTVIKEEYDIGDQTKLIGLHLSNSCITLVKNNFDTPCPSYKTLIMLDNSDTNISGKFGTDDGFFHRKNTKVQDSWRGYDHKNKVFLIVDPPAGMPERIKMIKIVPHLDNFFTEAKTIPDRYEYVETKVNSTLGNGTKAVSVITKEKTGEFSRVLYHDWYMDGCRNAVISAKVWTEALPKVLYELRNNCPNDFIGDMEIITPEYREIDLRDSPTYQQKWFWEAEAERCKLKC